MMVFHRTTWNTAKEIIEFGFENDGRLWGKEGSDENYEGIWFLDRQIGLSEDKDPWHDIFVYLDIPEELFIKYEWDMKNCDYNYRKALIPAEEINRYWKPSSCEDE